MLEADLADLRRRADDRRARHRRRAGRRQAARHGRARPRRQRGRRRGPPPWGSPTWPSTSKGAGHQEVHLQAGQDPQHRHRAGPDLSVGRREAKTVREAGAGRPAAAGSALPKGPLEPRRPAVAPKSGVPRRARLRKGRPGRPGRRPRPQWSAGPVGLAEAHPQNARGRCAANGSPSRARSPGPDAPGANPQSHSGGLESRPARMAGPERRIPSMKRRLAVGGGRSSPNSNAAARTARRSRDREGRASLPVGLEVGEAHRRHCRLSHFRRRVLEEVLLEVRPTRFRALAAACHGLISALTWGVSSIEAQSFFLHPERFDGFGLLMAEVAGKPRGGLAVGSTQPTDAEAIRTGGFVAL